MDKKIMDKKLILLTNDDGIESEGIYSLYRVLEEESNFDIRVIAPDKESSASGHAITVFRPISVRKEYREGKLFGYAVDGTPADCVKIANSDILERTPDLLISGINRGANVGENIIYSGTVSAATEGTTLGITSMAVSVDNLVNPEFNYAASFAKKVALRILENGGLPAKTLLNINIPDVPENEIKGVVITRQSNARVKDKFIKRVDPRGRDYYWMDGEFKGETVDMETDYCAIKSNYISITPIHYDMTEYGAIDYFKKWDIDK